MALHLNRAMSEKSSRDSWLKYVPIPIFPLFHYFFFSRAKDHEIASYDTEQIVDVPGAEEIQAEGKQCYI